MMLQVYASELRKFDWLDSKKKVLVAGEGVTGIFIGETADEIDIDDLVGAGDPEPQAVKPGTKWELRADEPIVTSEAGGRFAFMLPSSL